jgi:hypothetical protein
LQYLFMPIPLLLGEKTVFVAHQMGALFIPAK